MAAPEGYELLARIGFVDRGNYSASATYLEGDVVYYNGSTWTALKDNLKGVTPVSGANWKYMARGFAAELLKDVKATDTSGLKGTAGAQVDAQALIDAIADRVATKLLLKTDVTNQIINDATKAASAAALYSVNEELKRTNSNFSSIAPKHLINCGTFRGEITRNTSMVSGKQISLSITIVTPDAGIPVDTPFFYINGRLKPTIIFALTGGFVVGYLYGSVNEAGDSIFHLRTASGAAPANAELFLFGNCEFV